MGPFTDKLMETILGSEPWPSQRVQDMNSSIGGAIQTHKFELEYHECKRPTKSSLILTVPSVGVYLTTIILK